MANRPPSRHPDHENLGHPSQDSTGRLPDDQLLRRHGYRIHARPKRGRALWLDPAGRLVSQAEALARVELQGEEEWIA